MELKKFEANDIDLGKRLDSYLTERIDNYSRTYIQKLIEETFIKVNGKIIKTNYKLRQNDKIEVQIPEPINLEVVAENIPLDVVFEDKEIIIINKAQGMVVHPAHGNYTGTLVNALLYHCDNLSGINGILRPGIVHRIDKDTSGIIVVAKSNEAHMSLSQQLKEHTITRKYTALLEGKVKIDKGIVETYIGRNPSDRKKMAVVNSNGKKAVTHYKIVQSYDRNTLIEAQLETGRTHQIRVHMAYIGHPVVGDLVYGIKKQRFDTSGQLLHARVLGFIHPKTNKYLEFEARLPDYFQNIVSKL